MKKVKKIRKVNKVEEVNEVNEVKHTEEVKEVKKEKPKCKLIGEDGNVFNIIGRVKKALERAGMKEEAKEFVEKAFKCGSYHEVLALTIEYVDVV